jgi:hypothetical protein
MPAKQGTSLKSGIAAAAAAVAAAIESLPAPGMIIGGVAVILHGVPRLTRDVDATVDGSSISVVELARHLEGYDIVQRIEDALAFARENQVLLLRHQTTGVDVDLSLAWLPFELEAIAGRMSVSTRKLRAQIARPEDLVVYKAIAWRPQDQQDVERLLTLYGRHMDLVRVRAIVAELAAAIDAVDRLEELDVVIARATDTS